MTETFSSPSRYWQWIVSLFLIGWDNEADVSLCPDLEFLQPFNFIAQQSIQLCLWEGLRPLKFIWYWVSRGIHKLSSYWLLHHMESKTLLFLRESVNKWMCCHLCMLSLPCSCLRPKTGFSVRGLTRSRDSACCQEQEQTYTRILGTGFYGITCDLPWTKAVHILKTLHLEATEKPAFRNTCRKQKWFCYGCSMPVTWDREVNKNKSL